MKKAIYTTLLILAVSCSSDKCSDLQSKMAMALANQLECTNVAAIQEDIVKFVPLNCKDKQTGVVCAFMVDPLVEYALDLTVSKRWECKMLKTKDQLKTLLSAACAAI